MKRYIMIIAASLSLCVSCVTCPVNDCPSEDMYTYIRHPMFGFIPIRIYKGFFNKDNKEGNWMTEQEWKQLRQEKKKQHQRQPEKKDNNHTTEDISGKKDHDI